MEELVAELRERTAFVARGGGTAALEKHRSRGKLTARERIDRLVEPDSAFLELCALAAWGLYDDQAPAAGIITGIGVIEGHECVIAKDATVKSATYCPSVGRRLATGHHPAAKRGHNTRSRSAFVASARNRSHSGNMEDALPDPLGRIAKRLFDVFGLEVRVGGEDLLLAHPVGDHVHHGRNLYAEAPDARNASNLVGPRCDPLERHLGFLLVQFSVYWDKAPGSSGKPARGRCPERLEGHI